MRRNRVFLVLALAGAAALAAVTARAEGLETGIAVRENVSRIGSPRLISPGLPERAYWLSATAVRPTLSYASQGWSVETAVEMQMSANDLPVDDSDASSAGASSMAATASAGSPYSRGTLLERFDMTLDPVRAPDVAQRFRVERLKFSYSLDVLDIEVGRQPVSMGTSRFVGVLDVIAPFPPGDLDSTYKPGVDALRLRTPIGDEGEAELIAAAAEPWRESALVGRVRHRLGSVDGEVVFGKFRRRLFGGIGWEGDAGPLAIWGETALFARRLEKEVLRHGWGEAAFMGVAGADWRVHDNTLIGAAYMRNGFGARRARNLSLAALDAPYQEGWVFLGGREYAVLTFHAEPHPLVKTDLSGTMSLTDGSHLWQPRVTISVSDNADLTLHTWLTAGRRPIGPVVRSEFGSMADGFGLYGRVFF